MRAELIDGKAIAADVRADVARDVAALRERGVVPGLTVVLVGDDIASATYVGAKERASREAGMAGGTIRLPADTTQAALLTLIEQLAPAHIKKWTPSATGIGLACVINFSDSIAFLIGALLAWVYQKRNAAGAELYVVPISSGIIAGESIMGIVIALAGAFGVM